MRITALHSGGDWFDANAEYLIIPDTVDIEAERVAWHKWFNEEYWPLHKAAVARREKPPKYDTFFEWLLRKEGVREPTEDELIVIDGDA